MAKPGRYSGTDSLYYSLSEAWPETKLNFDIVVLLKYSIGVVCSPWPVYLGFFFQVVRAPSMSLLNPFPTID